MNYQKIYNNLIERAKTRVLENYTEKHHIIPRCLGGTDDSDNLIDLTPEEHYVAHQLLVKIYPNNHALEKAATMMIPGRPTNKMYGWLRRRLSKSMSESQSGKGNSQYGKRWIHSISLKKSRKILKNEPLPPGWEEGRIITDWDKKYQKCNNCGVKFEPKHLEKYCSDDCKQQQKTLRSPFHGREEEFLNNYDNLGSMNKALKEMGFPGAISHWYKWAKKVLEMRE